VTHLDGEIHSARWFTAPELAQAIAEQRTGEPKLELPGTNAVARRKICHKSRIRPSFFSPYAMVKMRRPDF